MRLTLGMTGMDSATEEALKAAVVQANDRLTRPWQLLPEDEASHVVVDMDSMYGPMSWLRLHAAGKCVIGLSSAARTQTDFHLARPFDAASVGAMLERAAAARAPETTATDAMAPPVESRPDTETGALVDAADLPTPPAEPPEAEAGTAPVAEAVESPAAPQRDPRLVGWLAPGALDGRVRYQPGDGPALLIDAEKRIYHGPATLKGLAGHFQAALASDDFTRPGDEEWSVESSALGPAQPLSRLQWFGGLLAGNGTLLPGFDPEGRFRMVKWPQTEREFPKHFRLATTMMKGPATLDEIAEASGVERADVVDFVNANLASGYAEPVGESPPEAPEPTKSTGLFGRLRGK